MSSIPIKQSQPRFVTWKEGFPKDLREELEKAIRQISPVKLVTGPKADTVNKKLVDEKIADILKRRWQIQGHGGVRAVTDAKFDCDLLVKGQNYEVLVEFEKGNAARIELDLMKFMAYSSQKRQIPVNIYGCLVVSDKPLQRSITGNKSGESAFDYFNRLINLFDGIACPAGLKGILVAEFITAYEKATSATIVSLGSKNADLLPAESRRYDGRIYGKRYVYWWDISPERRKKLESSGEIVFMAKDTELKCYVQSTQLLPLLTPERQTTRGKGNWGIRVLSDHPNELAIEPRRGQDPWEYLAVKWQM